MPIRKRGERRRQKHLQKPRPKTEERPAKPFASNPVARPISRQSLHTLTATVEKKPKGFAFLVFDSAGFEDAFVPAGEAHRLFHGDRVLVTISGLGADGRAEVVSLKLLAHRYRELVGRFVSGTLMYESRRLRLQVPVTRIPPQMKVRDGDWARARLVFPESKGALSDFSALESVRGVTAELIAHYGEAVPASADVEMIAGEFGLTEPHSDEAVKEALAYGTEIPQSELKAAHRTDLTHLPFMTIDGETARDFDDAVHVEKTNNGYTLWVAIADVSHYVKPDTALDREAYERATSVYFPERAFHMLPPQLSENLCSLRPNVNRLALVAEMNFDTHGRRTDLQVYDAVIRSQRRATYNEIENEKDQWPELFELYHVLRKAKSERGSIDFDLPEAEVLVEQGRENYGEPVSIENRARLDAHRLIEEFMIAANEGVTEWALERGLPFLYRIHEEPTPAALSRFAELASQVGVAVPFAAAGSGPRGRSVPQGPRGKPPWKRRGGWEKHAGQGARGGDSRTGRTRGEAPISGPVSPKLLADFIRKVEGSPYQSLLNMALLRSMRQAVYSASHSIHFGLASKAYTHFTSPIRRYPDLIVHRILKLALQAERSENEARRALDRLRHELGKNAEHCSYRERLASDADREAIRVKQVRIMAKHLGDEFEGKVSGMNEHGLFAQVTSPYVDGFLSFEFMKDDRYEYNEERMLVTGRRKRRVFRVGDPITVRVIRADFERRQVEYELADSDN